MTPQKSPFQSKTLWINLLIAGFAFFPTVQTYVQQHPLLLSELFVVLNVALRLVTKDKISLGE